MSRRLTRLASPLFILFTFLLFSITSYADVVKGIYITQPTLEDTDTINYLIKNAKRVGINTFVVDMEKPGKRYEKNIALLKENGIRYVARVVMFPGGGTPEQINSEEYWKRKYALVQAAVGYGAQEIQLDYIRYNTHSGASSEHAKNVYKIVNWYKNQLAQQNIPLQIDVFGISSFGEEKNIGQSIPLFSQTVDAICPMLYPSHFFPYKEHADTPYDTIYDSISAIKDQFGDKVPVKLIVYVELSNYHYPLSHSKKVAYIEAQLKAVKDSGVEGWYAWSANNYYDILFEVLAPTDKSELASSSNEKTL